MVDGKPMWELLVGKCIVKYRGPQRVRVRVKRADGELSLLSYVQIVASMGPGTYGTKLILSQPLKTKVPTEFCTHSNLSVFLAPRLATSVFSAPRLTTYQTVLSAPQLSITTQVFSAPQLTINHKSGIFSSAANSKSKFNCTANAVFCSFHQLCSYQVRFTISCRLCLKGFLNKFQPEKFLVRSHATWVWISRVINICEHLASVYDYKISFEWCQWACKTDVR